MNDSTVSKHNETARSLAGKRAANSEPKADSNVTDNHTTSETDSQGIIDSSLTLQYAQTCFREILRDSESVSNSPDMTRLGRYEEPFRLLLEEWQNTNDFERVRKRFDEMARLDPSLNELVSGSLPRSKIRWTVRDLLNASFGPLLFLVPGLIAVGLIVLGGRPKVGKSWMAMQLIHAVATGGKFLDHDVEQGSVLYLALEDSPRRLKDRLEKQGVPQTADVVISTAWPSLTEGGIDALEHEISNGDYKLIVVDTFSMAIAGGRRTDQMEAGPMTELFSKLHNLTINHNITILLVDHHRKPNMQNPDPIDDLFGSTGKAAVVDTALGLYRIQGAKPILKIRSRETEDQSLVINWDDSTWSWQLIGDEQEVGTTSRKAEVLEAIKALRELGEITSTKNIAEFTERDSSHVNRDLIALLNEGKVLKGRKIGRQVPYHLVENHTGDEDVGNDGNRGNHSEEQSVELEMADFELQQALKLPISCSIGANGEERAHDDHHYHDYHSWEIGQDGNS